MKSLLVLVAVLALLVLTVTSVAAFEPNSPQVVPDSPEVVPDSPELGMKYLPTDQFSLNSFEDLIVT